MPRLVEHHFNAAGQGEGRCDPPAPVFRVTSYVDSLAPQLLDGATDVVAHECQLMADTAFECRAPCRVNSELCRRQGEDEPSIPGIDVPEAEDVP